MAFTNHIHTMSSQDLEERLSLIVDADIEESEFQERTKEAEKLLDDVYIQGKEALDAQRKLDKEDAERKAEAERLEKIRVEQEAKQREIDHGEAILMNERFDFEKEKEAEATRQREKKIADEAAAKAIKDENDRKEQEEKDRIAKEKADAEEAARQEALKPDKEKLIDFANKLLIIVNADNHPTIDNYDVRQLYMKALDGIEDVAIKLKERAKAL